MKIKTKQYFNLLFQRVSKFLHFIICIGVFVLFGYLFYTDIFTDVTARTFIWNAVLYGAVLLILFRTYNAYYVGFSRIGDLIFSQFLSQLLSLCLVYAANCLYVLELFNPLMLLVLLAVQLVFDIIWCFFANIIYFRTHKSLKTCVIYGKASDLDRVSGILSNSKKFTVCGKIKASETDIASLTEKLGEYLCIVVCGVEASLQDDIAEYCVREGKIGYFAPHIGDIIMAGSPHVRAFDVPVLSVSRRTPKIEYLILKRILDIVASAVGIIILSPFMLVVSVAIKLYDGGPVLYKQTRLTRDGETFRICKFRSMRTDAEKDGVARLATENDDRITPVGKILRKLRLDELPQLFNILGGSMTIVGPRPERPEIAEQYYKELPEFKLRLQVKAGLTGYAQVYGKYNTEPYDKLQMDLMYINNMSFVQDLKLILATIRVVFMKDSTSGVEKNQVTAIKARTLAEPEKAAEKEKEKEKELLNI